MKKIVFALFFLLVTGIPGLTKKHSPLIEKRQQQIREIHRRLQEAQQRLREANRREHDVAHQLNQAEIKLHRTVDDLNRYSTDLHRTALNLIFTKRRLAAAEEEYANQKFLLSDRLNQIYENGKAPLLDFILGADSYANLLDRLYYLHFIVEQDIAIARNIQAQKNRITTQKTILNQQYAEIHGIREKVKVSYSVYSNITASRKNLLYDARRQRAAYAQHVVELEEISAELERELQELIRREQAKNQATHHHFGNVGAFLWPVGSREITSPFGWRMHPIYGTQKFHTGVDIAAGTGSPIRATADGVVIYAGWYGGYGEAVVIDHGNGLSSVYAHCSVIYVRKGENVRQGQTIAGVGSTGNATGPHLHFEVRENGTAIDPIGKF